MAFVRAILIILISLAVAILPATAGTVAFAKSSDISDTQSAPSVKSSHDCDHHGSSHDHGSKAKGICGSMAACALNCFSYFGPGVSNITFTMTMSTPQLIAAADLLVSKINNPLFRPPRV
jgi:hypothetical protein